MADRNTISPTPSGQPVLGTGNAKEPPTFLGTPRPDAKGFLQEGLQELGIGTGRDVGIGLGKHNTSPFPLLSFSRRSRQAQATEQQRQLQQVQMLRQITLARSERDEFENKRHAAQLDARLPKDAVSIGLKAQNMEELYRTKSDLLPPEAHVWYAKAIESDGIDTLQEAEIGNDFVVRALGDGSDGGFTPIEMEQINRNDQLVAPFGVVLGQQARDARQKKSLDAGLLDEDFEVLLKDGTKRPLTTNRAGKEQAMLAEGMSDFPPGAKKVPIPEEQVPRQRQVTGRTVRVPNGRGGFLDAQELKSGLLLVPGIDEPIRAPVGTKLSTEGEFPSPSKTEGSRLEEARRVQLDALQRVNDVEDSLTNPEFLSLPGRSRATFFNALESGSAGLLSFDEDFRRDMRTFQVAAASSINEKIRELSGGAVPADEAKRLIKQMADASSQSFTDFVAAFKATKKSLLISLARNIILSRGDISLSDPESLIALGDLEKTIVDATFELTQELVAQGMGKESAFAEANRRIRKEFGTAPQDFD